MIGWIQWGFSGMGIRMPRWVLDLVFALLSMMILLAPVASCRGQAPGEVSIGQV